MPRCFGSSRLEQYNLVCPAQGGWGQMAEAIFKHTYTVKVGQLPVRVGVQMVYQIQPVLVTLFPAIFVYIANRCHRLF